MNAFIHSKCQTEHMRSQSCKFLHLLDRLSQNHDYKVEHRRSNDIYFSVFKSNRKINEGHHT